MRLAWSHAAFRGRGLTLDPVSYSSEDMAAWRAAWFRSHPLPAELVEKLKGAVEDEIASGRIFRDVDARSDDLQVLCDCDPKAADAILDKHLPDRGKLNRLDRYTLLHTAVQRGRLEFADELLALARPLAFRTDQPCLVLAMLVQRGRKDLAPELIKEVAAAREQNLKAYGKSEIEECLPATGDEAALRQYVEWLSGMPRGHRIGYDITAFPSWEYQKALGCLAAAHPKVYYGQGLTLIQSDSIIDRRLGEKACGVRELGFVAAALAADRTEQLKRVRPICERLGDLSETDRVALVLRECGCRLQGAPGQAWIPELVKAAAGPDRLVSDRATWLVGRILGESFSPPDLGGLRDTDRALLLTCWLRDRGVEP